MKINKEKNYEVILTLVVVLVFVHLAYHVKWMLQIAIALGLAGLLFYSLSSYVSRAFLYVSEIIGFIMPKILLTIVFVVILIPISLLYKIKKTDLMDRKKKPGSAFKDHTVVISKSYFEKTW